MRYVIHTKDGVEIFKAVWNGEITMDLPRDYGVDMVIVNEPDPPKPIDAQALDVATNQALAADDDHLFSDTDDISATQALGGQGWFALGDKDLATHLARTDLLRNGASLTQSIRAISQGFGVTSDVLPSTDQPSPTALTTVDGKTISFQEYFVKLRHAVEIADIAFPSASDVRATAQVVEALTAADLIVIAPSNPLLSINPILAIRPIGDILRERRNDVCAVSPLIGGRAIKGPADRLMAQLGYRSDAAGVATLYAEYVSTLVIDNTDGLLADKIASIGCRTLVGDTMMSDDQGQDRVAALCLEAYRESPR